MADRPHRIFAYGTLQPGFGNHRRIATHVRSARPGTIQGVLVDLGAFPALIHGDGRVRGVLLGIDAEALRITDFIEGYRADGGRSLYVREMTEVDVGDGSAVSAWTYLFARPDHIEDRPRIRVGDADGRAHLLLADRFDAPVARPFLRLR